MTTHAWVVGARGLLGSAIARRVAARDGWQLVDAAPLPWHDPASLAATAQSTVGALLERLAPDDDWCMVWAAGRVVTSSTAAEFDDELSQFTSVLDGVALALDGAGGSHFSAVFYASSAGGVYAGSADPPFSELSPPVPISGYGHFKLAAENAVARFADERAMAAVVGRIANLYGPGQSLDKMQGLISHLTRAQLSPAPASVYVSLDTLRDYIYVDDCAELVLDCVARAIALARAGEPRTVTKNLATGTGVTIASLIGQLRSISRRNANVMLGTSAAAALQAHDLRLTSVVWPDLDRRDLTPLPVGMHNTLDEMRALMQRGR
jgi:UDP-glucose 4-epimerase